MKRIGKQDKTMKVPRDAEASLSYATEGNEHELEKAAANGFELGTTIEAGGGSEGEGEAPSPCLLSISILNSH